MKSKGDRPEQAAELRRRAEEIARDRAGQSPENLNAMSPEETRQTLHDLRVHQIELEMQNEELRRAQMALDAARARYFDLYDLAPVGYCTVSEKGLILEANLTAATLLGVARGALIKQLLTRFILKEDVDIYYLHRKQLFKTGTPQASELRMVKKDGTAFWAHLEATAAKDEDGAPVCHVVLSNITERREEAEALRESELKYRALVECSSDAIFCVDEKGQYKFTNHLFASTFGKPPDYFIGKTFWDVYPKEHADYRYEAIKRVFQTGESESLEVEVPLPSKTLYFYATANPIKDETGKVILSLTHATDITDRKRVEKALLESETNFRTFFESVIDMIIVCTPDGRLLFTNAAVTRTLGYTADELKGMHLLDVHPADKRREAEEIFAAIFKGERESCPLPLARKDGGLVPVDTRAWLGRWNGVGCIFGIFKNLTAEQEAQQRFERLFRNNPAPMALSTVPDRRFFDVNDSFLKVLGYSRDDIIDKTATELDLFPHTEQQAAIADKLRTNGRIADFELQVRRKDGAIIDGLLSGDVIDSQGQQYFLTVMKDVTERKLVEAYREIGREVLQILNEPGDLQDSIQRVIAALKTRAGFDAVGFRLQDGDDFPYFAQKGFSKDFLLTENTLIERAADGGVCRDKDGNVSLECTCGLVILGKTDSANPLFTLGGSCWTNDSFLLLDIPPGEDPRVHPRNQCIHQGYASVALVPIRNKGRIVGLIQLNDRRKNRFTLDIVELLEGIAEHIGAALMRKRAEEAMRESEEKHRLLIENSHDIIYTLTPDGVFTFVSAAWTELLGHPVTQVAGQPFQPFVHPDDLAGCMAWLQKVIETGQRQEGVEYRVRHINGSWRWHTSSAVPLRDEAGTIIGFEGTARDITERRKAEEALQKALNDVKTLRGIVPICANCKKIRDDQGYWNQVEVYVRDHTEAEFSHSICPECMTKLYSGFGQDHGSAPENDGGAQ